MKKIVILYGGRSGEHEVSLVSAASIVRHLDASLFEPVLVGASKEGEWYLQEGSVAEKALGFADGESMAERRARVTAAAKARGAADSP